MKRVVLVCVVALAACDGVPAGGSPTTFREFMVIGNTMTFEQCRARGGLIIRDPGSPMVACDPHVVREPVPADEFDHPGAPTSG
ncbi:hypothetical protein [Yoonia sp.]|uniref:hypothetical protein n=1 Tax=Yoonia sp. TaxID=2212373 RepID=UPI0025EB6723|nr:hypothetical protein [Yoonia sp.]